MHKYEQNSEWHAALETDSTDEDKKPCIYSEKYNKKLYNSDIKKGIDSVWKV